MPFQYDQSGELIGLIQRLNSPGFIQMYGGASAPGGWLFCDGSELDPLSFPDLYLVIGTSFNTGGETPGFFRIPDFRSRSAIGVGQGTGLSPYLLADRTGEENHLLTTAEMPTHTHLQNAHTHLQDSHTHLQDSHNHTQNAHTHTQNAHTHIQDTHTHVLNYGNGPGGASLVNTTSVSNAWAPQGSLFANGNTVATNQNTTATNQNTTATNLASTAINQSTTATNQNTTATNQNEGGGTSHNTIHPVLAVHFMIKY